MGEIVGENVGGNMGEIADLLAQGIMMGDMEKALVEGLREIRNMIKKEVEDQSNMKVANVVGTAEVPVNVATMMCSYKSPITAGLLIALPDYSLNRFLFVKYGLEWESAVFVLASVPKSNDDELDRLVVIQNGQVKTVEYTHIHYHILNDALLCTTDADNG